MAKVLPQPHPIVLGSAARDTQHVRNNLTTEQSEGKTKKQYKTETKTEENRTKEATNVAYSLYNCIYIEITA